MHRLQDLITDTLGSLQIHRGQCERCGAEADILGPVRLCDDCKVKELRAHKKGLDMAREHARLERTGLPRRYWEASFEGPRETQAMTAARQYAAMDCQHGEYEIRAGRCLVLAGPTGTGKTWAAAAVICSIRGRSRFHHASALMRCFLSDERDAAMREAETTPLLVLDDLGSEHHKAEGFAATLIEELLISREAEQRATIITSNLSPEKFKRWVSARIVDRINGDWGRVVTCGGPSLRQASAAG